MTPGSVFTAFLDAGVPVSVGGCLSRHGCRVIYHREALPDGATDDEVCATAVENSAVLVVIDNDINRIARRYGAKAKLDRFKRLHVLHLCCPEPQAEARIDQAMTLVLMEWELCRRKTARRLWIEIGSHHIRTNR